jgi:regulatory protein
MTVERFDGVGGDGLAPVTYLFGERSQRAPSNPTTPDESREARVSRVDVGRADRPPLVDLPTMATVFGELESHIEAQLAERRDAAPTSPEERDADKAKARAERVSMTALTRRGMSKREVERSLRARELDDETVVAELDRLEGVGLIDDMALAQNLVGTLQERKGLGRSAIAAELTRRLLAPAAIEYALDLIETGDELGRAREIAVKRAGRLRSYDRETAVRRLSAFLMRRGYSGSTVRAAVEHALPANPGGTVRFR